MTCPPGAGSGSGGADPAPAGPGLPGGGPYEYTLPLVAALPGRTVAVRCQASPDVVRRRYRVRQRSAGHLDDQRSADELWGSPVTPLGVGPLFEVDTERAVDLEQLATRIRASD